MRPGEVNKTRENVNNVASASGDGVIVYCILYQLIDNMRSRAEWSTLYDTHMHVITPKRLKSFAIWVK